MPVDVVIDFKANIDIPNELLAPIEVFGYLGRKANPEGRKKALVDVTEWGIAAPLATPVFTVFRDTIEWHFIVAAESEGLLSSFKRLQLLRSWRGNGDSPAHEFGVITYNRELTRMAEAQGFMTF